MLANYPFHHWRERDNFRTACKFSQAAMKLPERRTTCYYQYSPRNRQEELPMRCGLASVLTCSRWPAAGDRPARRWSSTRRWTPSSPPPIFERFTAASGIAVLPKFDAESTKTVGLAEAILAESGRPRCDVFWNNEILHTCGWSGGPAGSLPAADAEQYPAAYRDRRRATGTVSPPGRGS